MRGGRNRRYRSERSDRRHDRDRSGRRDRDDRRGRDDNRSDRRHGRRRDEREDRDFHEIRGERYDDAARDDRDREDYREDRDFEREGSEREARPAPQPVPVAGIVDILDSYAFVRTSGYLPGPNDVYISMGAVHKYGLRKGDAIQGTIRPPRENQRGRHQKFVPLQSVETINGMPADQAQNRPEIGRAHV